LGINGENCEIILEFVFLEGRDSGVTEEDQLVGQLTQEKSYRLLLHYNHIVQEYDSHILKFRDIIFVSFSFVLCQGILKRS
jgi:hypothetical protein